MFREGSLTLKDASIPAIASSCRNVLFQRISLATGTHLPVPITDSNALLNRGLWCVKLVSLQRLLIILLRDSEAEARPSGTTNCTRSRQITTPAPHHSVFYRPDALPAAQPTASKHLEQITPKRRYAIAMHICSTLITEAANRRAPLLFLVVMKHDRYWSNRPGRFVVLLRLGHHHHCCCCFFCCCRR